MRCGTQEKLAKKAGITQGAIGKYLRGDALPTGVTANKLSFAVDGTQDPASFAPHIFIAASFLTGIPREEIRPDIFGK